MPITREARIRWALGAIGLSAFVLMLAFEVATDDEPVRISDLLSDAVQMLFLVATAVACAMLASRMHGQHEEKLELIRDLQQAKTEGESWRREARSHVMGLGVSIEKQFEHWGLTNAEREVGFLMLKGFMHKEIAVLRSTSDATVRHQAKAIYEKAGVENRTGFCAYFLEDLLPERGNHPVR